MTIVYPAFTKDYTSYGLLLPVVPLIWSQIFHLLSQTRPSCSYDGSESSLLFYMFW